MDFPLSLIMYFQQIYILGMWNKRGEHYFPCSVSPLPNEPVSLYRCVSLPKTDDNDRTHEIDANARSWHDINASFWTSALWDQFKSILLEWAITQKKQGRWRWEHSSLKKIPELFSFCSVPLELPPLEI